MYGVYRVLVLWHATLGERFHHLRFLRNQERRHELRNVVYGVGRGRNFGPKIGGVMFDKYQNYQMAFYTAAVLAAVALVSEFMARRPKHI